MRRDGAGGYYDIIQTLPALLIFDRRLQCRPARGSNEWKGTEKLDRVSPVRCHKQIGLKCTGREPSLPGRATAVLMVRQRSAWLKPL